MINLKVVWEIDLIKWIYFIICIGYVCVCVKDRLGDINEIYCSVYMYV